MAVTMTLDGLDALRQRLDALVTPLPEASKVALLAEGNAIMVQAQRLVPVDTGNLRATGAVRPDDSAAQPTVEISFGGNGIAPYAVVQHERTDFHHPIGQSHYLQEPYFAATSGMLGRLAAALRAAL